MPVDLQTAKITYANPGWDCTTTAMSISMWVYLDAYAPGGGGSYLWHAAEVAGGTSFRHYFRTSEFASGDVAFNMFGGGSRRTDSGLLPLGVWTNLIVTKDLSVLATGIHIYIAGTEATYATGGNGTTPNAADGNWTIGGNAADSARSTDGRIHKVGTWSRVLTSDEIAFLAAGGDPATITTGATFKAPYDTSTDAINASGATITGTATGTATMTTQYPADLPGLASWWDFGNGSNTITSNRLASMVDKAGNANTAVQSGTSGPAVRTTPDTEIGTGGVHANFSMTNTSATTFSETYVQVASGSGSTYNAQNMTVVFNAVVRFTPATDTGADPNCVINFGDPASTGANAGVCRISIERGGKIVCIDSAGSERLSGAFFDAGHPRQVAVVFSSTGTKIRIAGVNFSVSAMTAASATGVRIGARNHNSSSTNYFVGDNYQIKVYQRGLSDTEIDTLNTLSASTYGYSAPSMAIALACTSTGAGYLSTDNVTFLKLIAAHFPTAYFFNGSAPSQRIDTLIAIYPNDCAQFATFAATMGIGYGNRHFMGVLFANDYQFLLLVTPDPSYDTSAEIQAGNQTYIDLAKEDYSTFTLYRAIVSGGWETYGDMTGTDTDREQYLIDWTSGVSGVTKVDRPALLRPASTSQEDLDAIDANGTYYNGDRVHMNKTGFKLWGTRTTAGTIVQGLREAMFTGGFAGQWMLLARRRGRR